MSLLRIAARIALGSAQVCGQCGVEAGKGKDELRPYGPGGSLICYSCGTSDPEAEEQARSEFDRLMGEVEGPMLLTPDGPTALL